MYSCGKKSFTLSEVLITLVVIGIITAITVPVVMANINQEQYKAALRKNYTTLSNAFNLAYGYNYDDFRDWELENNVLEMTKDVFDRISGYLQISKICGSGAKRDECWAEKTYAKNREYAHWFTNEGKWTGGGEAYSFILNDGTAVILDIWGSDTTDMIGITENKIKTDATLGFFIDVNGTKAPNTLGKDIFAFALTNKGIVPGGIDNGGENCDNGTTKTIGIVQYKFWN